MRGQEQIRMDAGGRRRSDPAKTDVAASADARMPDAGRNIVSLSFRVNWRNKRRLGSQ